MFLEHVCINYMGVFTSLSRRRMNICLSSNAAALSIGELHAINQ